MAPKKLIRRSTGRLQARRVGDATEEEQPRPTRLRAFRLGEGLPSLPELELELIEMRDVLMGRTDPPIDDPLSGLQEVADAYYARAAEITMILMEMERKSQIFKGSQHYHFRTGELRVFMEMAKRAADLGSRRITAAQLRWDQELTGRESKGNRG